MDNSDFGKLYDLADPNGTDCKSNWQQFAEDFTISLEKLILKEFSPHGIKISSDENFGGHMWNFYVARVHTHDCIGKQYKNPYIFNHQIGCMHLEPLNGDIIWSQSVQVNDEFTGKGLGQKLLQLRIEAARNFGFKEYWCSVVETNERQKHILRKHGFVRAVEGQRIWRLVL